MTYIPGLFPVVHQANGSVDTLTVDVTNMPNGTLELDYILRSTTAAIESATSLRINADSGNNYNTMVFEVNEQGTIATPGDGPNVSAFDLRIPADNSPTSYVAGGQIVIPDYKNTTRLKSLLFEGWYASDNANGNQFTRVGAGIWKNTNAITSVSIQTDSNFNAISFLKARVRAS